MSTSRTISRRSFLLSASVIGAAFLGGGGWYAWQKGVFSSGEGPAFEPWKRWRPGVQPAQLEMVQAAILASNPHNSQPWRFRVSDSHIEILADTTRNMGSMDPVYREMQIGLGCALENLVVAAAARGYQAKVTLPTETTAQLVIAVDLTPAQPKPTELYDAIARRHTNRAAYDKNRPLTSAELDRLTNMVDDPVKLLWLTAPGDRKAVGALVVEATKAIADDAEQMGDSGAWERFDWKSVQQNRDGITLDTQGLSPLMRAAGKLFPISSEQNARFWIRATEERYVGTAPAFGLIAVPDSSLPNDRIQGGRVWQRLHLKATAMGLAMQPLNQLTERADRETQLGLEPRFGKALAELVPPGYMALMTFRAGHPTQEAHPSPRRSLEQVIVE